MVRKKTGLIRHFNFKSDAEDKKQNTCLIGACMDVRGIYDNEQISTPEYDALVDCGLSYGRNGGNTESGFFLARNNDKFHGTPEERKEYIISFVNSEMKKRMNIVQLFFEKLFNRKSNIMKHLIIEITGNYTISTRFGTMADKRSLEKESNNNHIKWRIKPFINN